MTEAAFIGAWYLIGALAAWHYLVWSRRNAAFIALFVSLGPISAFIAYWA